MKNKLLKISTSLTIVLSLLLAVSISSAIQVDEVLIDDGFEGTPWNASWTGSWYDQNIFPVFERVHLGDTSAASSNYPAIHPGDHDGPLVSDPMDTSDALSIYIEFYFQKANVEDNDFNLTLWDGSNWNVIYALVDADYPNYPAWSKYNITISDSSYFVSDFRIAFNTSTGTNELVRVDDVYVTQTYESVYSLGAYTEGRGSILNVSSPYQPGTLAEITAEPEVGWSFVGWTDALAGETNPIQNLLMDRDKIVTAVFTKDQGITAIPTSTRGYDLGDVATVNLGSGSYSGQAMVQINLGATPLWADQITLSPTGTYSYKIKIPTTWTNSETYTVYVRDVDSNTTATTTFKTPYTAPTSGGGGGGGGGGSVLPSVSLLNLLSPKDAAEELEGNTARAVAGVLEQLEDKEHLADIIEYLDPNFAADVMSRFDDDLFIEVWALMSEESKIAILLDIDQTDIAFLKKLLDLDKEGAGMLIEMAVKAKISGLGETERKGALKQLAGALSSLDKTELIDLLISIAQLPETPSTVAYLFDSMSLSTVLDVVGSWVEDETYASARPDLVNVLSYVSEDYLATIYQGLTNSQRLALYPLLTATMVASLPELGEFKVSDLTVSPQLVEPSEEVTISYTINNIGDQSDGYIVTLKIDGETEQINTGFLNSGESITITHITEKATPGEYEITVDGASDSFTVEETEIIPDPDPADLQVIDVTIAPEEIYEGTVVSVFVSIKNKGELSGTESFTLEIDSVEMETKEITLAGDDTSTLTYSITADYGEGSHEISVGGETETFQVLKVPQGTPWALIIGIISVLAIGGYLYYTRYYNKEA